MSTAEAPQGFDVPVTRPLTCRLDGATYSEVERRRLEAGQSRSAWLRSVIESELAKPLVIARGDSAASRFCEHPPTKRLGTVCVACGTDLVPR
jgi:hypothetical protein